MGHYLKGQFYVSETLWSVDDETLDSQRTVPGGLFFLVISSGSGHRKKRWIVGLGSTSAYPVLPLASGETGLLETEGYLSKS